MRKLYTLPLSILGILFFFSLGSVFGQNHAPTAVDDVYEVFRYGQVSGNMSTNDFDVDYNLNLSSYKFITQPKFGTIAMLASGSFDYYDNGIPKADSIMYSVCDNSGLCDSAYLMINIKLYSSSTYKEVAVQTTKNTAVEVKNALIPPSPYYPYFQTNASNGSISFDSSSKKVLYRPNLNYIGNDEFELIICSKTGVCDTTIGYVTISQSTQSNNPPFAGSDYVTMPQNTSTIINWSTNDSDPDNDLDLKSFVITKAPFNGFATANLNGTCQYTPNIGFTGIDTMTYRVCDLKNNCATATIYINVIRVNTNHPPVASSDYVTILEDAPLSKSVASNATDIDGDLNPNSFTTIDAPLHGTIVLNPNGNYIYTPNSNFNGLDSVHYKVCDLGVPVFCDTASIIVTVISVNDAPIARDTTFTTNINTPLSNSVKKLVSDADNNIDTASFTLLNTPKRGTLVMNQFGNFTYTANTGFVGSDSCFYKVCDKGIPTFCDTGMIIIKVINNNTSLSIINQPLDIEECMGGNAALQVGVAGGTGVVTYVWQQSTDGVNFTSIPLETSVNFFPMSIMPSTIFYRCVVQAGTETVTSNSAMVTVKPSISFTSQPINIKLLYKSGTINADSNAVFKAAVTGGSGMMSYQWQCSSNNSTWSNLTENTTNVGTKTTTLTLVKPKISEVPYFHLVASASGSGCQAATSATGILTFQQSTVTTALSITAQPLDIEECMGGSAALQVGITGGTGVISYDWQQSADGVNFTTMAGATMPSFMPFSIMPGTTFYRCVVQSGTETVTSSSAKVNVNPSITFTSQPINIKLLYKSGTISADSNAVFKAAITGGSGMMSYQWQCSSNNSTWSNLTENTTNVGTKTMTLTLVKPKISEVPYFHLVASSTGSGCQAATSATGILTFEVKSTANIAPDAVNDNFTTIQAVAINATVATNDTDTEGALNLTSFKVVKSPKNGNLTMFNNGSFTYIPATPFIGNDTASYSVCDVPGLCDTAFVFFKVIKGNHLPSIVKDAFATKMNTALKGSVALNDSDFDNNLNKNSYKMITNPKNGNVKMWANGDILYLPKQNFIGRDTFYYQACDSLNLCGIAEAIVTTRGGFITGKIYYDVNNNGAFDNGDLGVPTELVTFDTDGKTFTSSIGDFQIAADTSKSYVITPVLNNPLWTVNPLSKTVKTSNNFDQLIENLPTGQAGQYFAVRPASQVSDLAVNVEAGNARPGFSSVTTLTYYNKGTTVLNGKVSLTLDNNVTYESSDVTLTQRSGNVLTWSVVNLQPFESRNLTIFVKTNLTAPLGKDVIYAYEGSLTGATDADATNSKGTATIAIRGSYDPNDITVDRREYIRKATDATTPNVPLAYTIRFQNTGNAEAIRVEVLDTIQEKLDLTAFEMIAASHKFEVQIVPDTNKVKRTYTVVKWIFDNINLLDSTSKEACSHGFVKYSIKNISTKTNYVKDSILNKAAIYFDFNAPVITNTATTKFSTLTVSSLEQYNLEFKAYPNPTNGLVNIELAHEADATIEIFNAVGQAVSRQILRGSNGTVDMSAFQAGLYILKIKTQKGSGSVKIFKE